MCPPAAEVVQSAVGGSFGVKQLETTMQQTTAALTASWKVLPLLIALACGMAIPPAATAQGEGQDGTDNDEADEKLEALKLADGRLVLQFPARWEKQRPSVRIIEVELKVPPKEEKASEPGRLTIMRAGGSVEANVERWYGQFEQPDGKSSKEAAKVEEKEVDDLKIHIVDLSGTFLDRRGPFAPATEKEDYRMLAAIIQTDGAGNYFIKFTGPQETIKQNEKAFMRMIDELEWTE